MREISKINLSQILNLKDNEEDEFFFDKFEDINNHIKEEHNFKLDNNTIFYGTCNNCSK